MARSAFLSISLDELNDDASSKQRKAEESYQKRVLMNVGRKVRSVLIHDLDR